MSSKKSVLKGGRVSLHGDGGYNAGAGPQISIVKETPKAMTRHASKRNQYQMIDPDNDLLNSTTKNENNADDGPKQFDPPSNISQY